MSKQTELDIKEEKKIETVEAYQFEPIKGYPMLNWHGKRPFTSTQYYPAQLKENHGAPVDGWMNRIYWGDNLQVMSHLLKEFRGKVDLVYRNLCRMKNIHRFSKDWKGLRKKFQGSETFRFPFPRIRLILVCCSFQRKSQKGGLSGG